MMRFASLGSGSKGNATLVESGDTCLMIDCGFNLKQTLMRLQKIGRKPEDITAIFLTHEHGDHIAGVRLFVKHFSTPVYLTAGTAEAEVLQCLHNPVIIKGGESYAVGSLRVHATSVSHDAKEPCQFVVEDGTYRLGVLTDAGYACEAVQSAFVDCDSLILEANYDEDMLASGAYPEHLKRRVAGDRGHLSNKQALALLQNLNFENFKNLIIAHVSEKNNHPDKITQLFRETLGEEIKKMDFICQKQGLDWRAVF